MLAAVRCGVLMLNLEIFLGLLFLNVVLFSESFSFTPIVVYQEVSWLIFVFLILASSIILVFLLEVNRAPFDLAEAESELVTGYSTEYGGFYFALFYLGEYFHLFFFSLIVAIFFFGGWEQPVILFFFLKKYSVYSFFLELVYLAPQCYPFFQVLVAELHGLTSLASLFFFNFLFCSLFSYSLSL